MSFSKESFDIVIFRFKVTSIISRWTSQVSRSPKFCFQLRNFCYNESDWGILCATAINIIVAVEKMLVKFFDRRFTTSNLNRKQNQLETEFKEALKSHFNEETAMKLVKTCRITPKYKDFLIRRIPELLDVDITDELMNDQARFADFLNLIGDNAARDLPPIWAENLFQVSSIYIL